MPEKGYYEVAKTDYHQTDPVGREEERERWSDWDDRYYRKGEVDALYQSNYNRISGLYSWRDGVVTPTLENYENRIDVLEKQQMYHVGRYGAQGDGILADEGPYIQAAIDDAAVKGGEVWIPGGVYNIQTTVMVKSGVRIRMASGAVLKRNDPTLSVILAITSSATQWGVVGGRIDGNASLGTDVYGIDFHAPLYGTIQGMWVTNGQGTSGIRILNGEYVQVVQNRVDTGWYEGIRLDGCQNTSVTANHAIHNEMYGIHILNSSYCNLEGNTCVGNRVYGIVTNNTSHSRIGNNLLRDNMTTDTPPSGPAHLKLTSSSHYNHVFGNTVRGSSDYAGVYATTTCMYNWATGNDVYGTAGLNWPTEDSANVPLYNVESNNRTSAGVV